MRSISPHAEPWLARLVLLAGLFILTATSAPPTWQAEDMLEGELTSEGAGDDKLLIIHVRVTDALATFPPDFTANLSVTADRPASDLKIWWIDPSSSAPDAGPDGSERGAGTQYGEDFLTLSSLYSRQGESCVDQQKPRPKAAACEYTLLARFRAMAPSAYALAFTLRVTMLHEGEHRPKGDFEVTTEVIDAPDTLNPAEMTDGP